MKLHHFRPKKQKRGLLFQVFIIVAIIQVALLVSFGSYIVARTVLTEQVAPEAPPKTAQVDRQVQERKVNVERQQKKSNKMNRRISIAPTANTAPSDINIALPAAISQGGGISAVSEKEMTANMKITTTTVEIQGIVAKTEKVLICIDAGPYLMTDERGGLDTYAAIREDIKKLVNALPSTVLFNLMAYDVSNGTTINFFQSTLVAATTFHKRMACDWINPINISLEKIGPGGNNYKLKYPFMPQPPQGFANYNQYKSNIYRIYQAALEQGADTIYILSTGWVDPDDIKLPVSDAEIERFRRAQQKYEDDVQKQRKSQGWTDEKQQEYERARSEARAAGIKKARDWIKKENEARAAKNKPLYTGTPENAMWENKFYVEPNPRPPSVKVRVPEFKMKSYGRTGLFKYYEKLFKEVYFDKKMRAPVLNMIVFRGKDEDLPPAQLKVIRAFTSANNGGRSRVLKGLKPVSDYDK